jgi:hypothetical protein
VFQATDEGRAHLIENEAEVDGLFERLDEAFPKREPGHPPIGRAIGNLMNALRHRVARDGFDDALVHEIPRFSMTPHGASSGSNDQMVTPIALARRRRSITRA